jgi:hypothetical protein
MSLGCAAALPALPPLMAAYVARDGVMVRGLRTVPEPGERQVLVRVAASAVNRADLLQRSGNYPPPPGVTDVLGLEASGTIVRVGPGCTAWLQIGVAVMALLAGGGRSPVEFFVCLLIACPSSSPRRQATPSTSSSRKARCGRLSASY